jgi:hypothetical protein
MRKRETKQVVVMKLVSQARLERGKMGHDGRKFLIDELRLAIAAPPVTARAIHKS